MGAKIYSGCTEWEAIFLNNFENGYFIGVFNMDAYA